VRGGSGGVVAGTWDKEMRGPIFIGPTLYLEMFLCIKRHRKFVGALSHRLKLRAQSTAPDSPGRVEHVQVIYRPLFSVVT